MSKKPVPIEEGHSPKRSKPNDDSRNSGIQITAVRIQNFRCLRAVEVSLSSTTLLIGENNAGKTSFLEALHAAIGSGIRQFTEDDLWTEPKEKHPPKLRSIMVDILIRPIDEQGTIREIFPDGSAWIELFGSGIQQDDNDRDFVAIRTKYAWSLGKGEYVAERKFLKSWPESFADMEKTPYVEKIQPLTVVQLTPISLFLLDAKRDGAEDIRTRGSVWHKLVSEPGLSDEDIDKIETNLNEINNIFVTKSTVLTHLQNHLCGVSDVVNCDKNGIAITPVARRLRDLNKGMDVLLSTSGASAVPLARQGMGTRSLASVLLFRAYMSWKMSRRKTDVFHPFLAIEEPETHLYPHAQRALYSQIESIPGQRIVSTHSPYICAQADIRSFIHFAKSGNETRVSRFDENGTELSEEDRRRINREVINTRGDLLFSRYIVIFEGETEEQALPAFAKRYWGSSPHDVGISFVGVGGSGKYTAFVRLAERFNIPWAIFSDGKPQDIKSVNDCLRAAGVAEYPNSKSVIVIPNSTDFEGMIASDDNLDLIRDMIVDFIVSKGSVNPQGVKPLRDSFAKKTGPELADELRREKTAFGARIADTLAKHTDPTKRIPKPIKDLLDNIRPVIETPPIT
jgi:putative ATP-dependent endonuclease of OLD family